MSITGATWFDDYNKFADMCEIPQGDMLHWTQPNQAAVRLAEKLVIEEWEVETKEALANYLNSPTLENLVLVADGIGDSIYVLCQLARSLGLPLNSIWSCIQSSNMAKGRLVNGEWVVKRREDGKILKPEGHKPPRYLELVSR